MSLFEPAGQGIFSTLLSYYFIKKTVVFIEKSLPLKNYNFNSCNCHEKLKTWLSGRFTLAYL